MKICGLDECGRGPLAGPIVAAGVVLRIDHRKWRMDLDDSKKLKAKDRERLFELIMESGAKIEVEVISVRQINSRGIGWANKEIFRRLIKKIEADKYIVDGNLKLGRIQGKGDRVKCKVKADKSRKCVMAASVVAKVTRDRLMKELHNKYPHYGWETNVGYGTKNHISAIVKHGSVPPHRRLFVETALKKLTP